MIISDVKIRTVVGIDATPGMIYDNKNAQRVAPTDIHYAYQKKRGHIRVTHIPHEDGTYHITHRFLEIETEAGITGVVGPISNPAPPFYILTQIRPLLIGQNAWHIGRLWDLMYRTAINGRKGENMQAISYVDCALWDIRAKCLGQPLYKLLGGKVQDKIRAYANTAGYPQDPESVAREASKLVEEGYTAIKWGVAYGPAAGITGMKRNIETVRILRETVGPDVLLMIDAWSSWDMDYTLQIAKRLEKYDLAFIEEPVMADFLSSYSYLNSKCAIPIAGGEHEYTRWGFKQMLDVDACSFYQPDPAWSGGVSECLKIVDLVSAYDRKALLHNSIPPLGIHISCSFPFNVIPLAEYLVLVGDASQYFYKNKCRPSQGYFSLPAEPGIGVEIDETKIVSQKYLSYENN
ncbi:MAG: enolase C-terminal domain-like protein [Saccharofermentanales bacterium]|jgi:L-rhamnonate dehydratase